jgi:alpha-tubulin suppressor-like RCC1 family protein
VTWDTVVLWCTRDEVITDGTLSLPLHLPLVHGVGIETCLVLFVRCVLFVSLGGEYTVGMATRGGGDVFVWGTGSNLGVPFDKESVCPFPCRVLLPRSFTAVACGDSFIMALADDGSIWTWGDNRGGRLGHNGEDGAPAEVQGLPNDGKATCIAAGQSHLAAVVEISVGTGDPPASVVVVWGSNFHKALGTAEPADASRPTQLPYFQDAITVAAGYANTACITAAGDVYIWGDNRFGKSGGGGDSSVVDRPVKVDLGGQLGAQCCLGSLYSAVVTRDGTVLTWGYGGAGNLGHGDRRSVTKPTVVESLRRVPIANVACTVGQINIVTDPKQVAGKENPHTLFVAKDTGALYACGTCHKGMLGNHVTKILSPPSGDELVPYHVGSVPRDGTQPTEYLNEEWCVAAASSSIHSAVLTQSGRLYAFGCASGGRMGIEQYMTGLHGGRSRMKCYVSKPTSIEYFEREGLHVCWVTCGRRHMAAIATRRTGTMKDAPNTCTS